MFAHINLVYLCDFFTMNQRKTFFQEKLKPYFILFTPWILSTWLLTIVLRTFDIFILDRYNALGYQFCIFDLFKAWLLDISLISLLWLFALILFYFFKNKYTKFIFLLLWSFWIIYSLLSIIFSYYTAFSELLPDTLLLNYNKQNMALIFKTYAYLIVPLFILFFASLFILRFIYIQFRKISTKVYRLVFLCLIIFTILIEPVRTVLIKNQTSVDKRVIYENKVFFFIKSILLNSSKEEIVNSSLFDGRLIINNCKQENFISGNFPLFRYRDSSDVLSPFFKTFDKKPNLVFIFFEGLGRHYSGPDALYGSFTPFLDSLAMHSLYWYNFLATSGRTFGVLPSVFASVPFGDKGFNELADSFPTYTSLLRNLKHNGYFISFFYGGWIHFDNMASFLKHNHADYLTSEFPKHYKKMGDEHNSWGYDDRTVFNHSLKVLDSFPDKPRVDIYLTLSNHNPWEYAEIDQYEKKLDQYFAEHPDLWSKQTNYFVKKRFASVLYTDDVLRNFFEAYKKRPDYENTIFIITGDHGLSYDYNHALKKFHVPLIIYSPKLKKTSVFKGVCSHLDIAPTIEQFLKNKAGLKIPIWTCYLGSKLDTGTYFKNDRSYVFIWESRTYPDILSNNFYLYKDSLYIVSDNFVQHSIVNAKISEAMRKKRLTASFMHKQLPIQNKIMPFSTFLKEYAVQIYPECTAKKNCELNKVFNDSDLSKEQEFNNLFELNCKQNNFGILYISGTIQLTLLSTESTTVKLVFETKDFNENQIGWQYVDFSLDAGETKSFNLNRYFILKQKNTFVPIKNIKVYFWNNNRANIQIRKLELKAYIE